MIDIKQNISNLYGALYHRPSLAGVYYATSCAFICALFAIPMDIALNFPAGEFVVIDRPGLSVSVEYRELNAAYMIAHAAFAGLCVGLVDQILWLLTGVRLRHVVYAVLTHPIAYARSVIRFRNIEGVEDLSGAGYPRMTRTQFLQTIAWHDFCAFIREHSYNAPNATSWCATIPNPNKTNHEMLTDIWNRAREVYLDLLEFGEVEDAMQTLAFNYNRAPMRVEFFTEDDMHAFQARIEILLDKLRDVFDPVKTSDELGWFVDGQWCSLSETEKRKLAKGA